MAAGNILVDICGTNSFAHGLDEFFDQVLSRLETLRGVQDLVFTDDFNLYWRRGLGNQSCRRVGTEEYRNRLRRIESSLRGQLDGQRFGAAKRGQNPL